MPRGRLRRGVISVGRVGSAGITAGEGIKRSHPDKQTCLCKGGGKRESCSENQQEGRSHWGGFTPVGCAVG